MLCFDYNCPKLKDGKCTIYPSEGMKLRDRLGYCPILDDGPNKIKKKSKSKVRIGQRKQKRRSTS